MPTIDKVLSIETSCDDTSIAIVEKNGWVHSVVAANQDQFHMPFGGIVPEVASRNHSQIILPLVQQAFEKANLNWSDIQGITCTNRPGLVGSLIVGLVTAKSLAQINRIPLLGVNHLEGHILAPFLKDSQYSPPENFQFPFICLAVSGGHSSIYLVHGLGQYQILGETLDDAAGEAFDKFAKMLGLGWPGGVKVDQLSTSGQPKAFDFPRSMIKEENFMMSFSGLKSSAHRLLQSLSDQEKKAKINDLCASFQEAITDVLLAKLDRAVRILKIKNVAITGGVSANSRLRQKSLEWAFAKKIQIVTPPLRYCTDNAAMIGYAGILRMNKGEFHPLNLGPSPSSYESDFQRTIS